MSFIFSRPEQFQIRDDVNDGNYDATTQYYKYDVVRFAVGSDAKGWFLTIETSTGVAPSTAADNPWAEIATSLIPGIPGAQGIPGRDGRDGRDGQDGRDGIGRQGIQGIPGRDAEPITVQYLPSGEDATIEDSWETRRYTVESDIAYRLIQGTTLISGPISIVGTPGRRGADSNIVFATDDSFSNTSPVGRSIDNKYRFERDGLPVSVTYDIHTDSSPTELTREEINTIANDAAEARYPDDEKGLVQTIPSRLTVSSAFQATPNTNYIHIFDVDVGEGLVWKDQDNVTDLTSANQWDIATYTGTHWRRIGNVNDAADYIDIIEKLENLTSDIHLFETPPAFVDNTNGNIAGIALIQNTAANRAALDARTFDFPSLDWHPTMQDIPDDGNDYWVVVRTAIDQGHIEGQFQVLSDDPEEGIDTLRRSRQEDANWRYFQVTADTISIHTLQRRETAHTRYDGPIGDIAIAQVEQLIRDLAVQDDDLLAYSFGYIGIFPRYARADQLTDNFVIIFPNVTPPFDRANRIEILLNGVPISALGEWDPNQKFMRFSMTSRQADNIISNTSSDELRWDFVFNFYRDSKDNFIATRTFPVVINRDSAPSGGGSGTPGQDGEDGDSVRLIFRRSSTALTDVPTGGSWNGRTFTAPDDWTTSIPSGTDQLYAVSVELDGDNTSIRYSTPFPAQGERGRTPSLDAVNQEIATLKRDKQDASTAATDAEVEAIRNTLQTDINSVRTSVGNIPVSSEVLWATSKTLPSSNTGTVDTDWTIADDVPTGVAVSGDVINIPIEYRGELHVELFNASNELIQRLYVPIEPGNTAFYSPINQNIRVSIAVNTRDNTLLSLSLTVRGSTARSFPAGTTCRVYGVQSLTRASRAAVTEADFNTLKAAVDTLRTEVANKLNAEDFYIDVWPRYISSERLGGNIIFVFSHVPAKYQTANLIIVEWDGVPVVPRTAWDPSTEYILFSIGATNLDNLRVALGASPNRETWQVQIRFFQQTNFLGIETVPVLIDRG